MRKSQLLWLDLRFERSEVCVDPSLSETYHIQLSSDLSNTTELIQFYQPRILCFDYDFPDKAGLDILLQTRRQFPDLPILMLSKEQSLDLALWALRSRVWNYFVKPVVAANFINSVDVLLNVCSVGSQKGQTNLMPQPINLGELWASSGASSKTGTVATQLAVDHVVEHCHSKFTLDNAAGLCCMSKSHFSRSFKKNHGITFQKFVMQQRINKAATLLKQSDASVTEVALSVGFSDLSHFNRSFQKYIGVGPSRFRMNLIR